MKSGNSLSKRYGLGLVGFPKQVSLTSPSRAVSLYACLDAVTGHQTRLPLSPYYNPQEVSRA
jgi:hypothetical protein